MCKKYTQDTSAVENGGLFEQVTKTGMTEELSNWIFDSSRQAGDTVAITVSDSTYVLYYIGQDQPEWKINIKNTLVSDTMSQHMQDITADVTVEDPKGKLNYLKVQAEESAAAETETATAETQEITEEQTAATEETATQHSKACRGTEHRQQTSTCFTAQAEETGTVRLEEKRNAGKGSGIRY